MKYLLTLLFCVILFSCNNNQVSNNTTMNTEDEAGPHLVKIWETDPVFITAESAIYDPKSNIIYVSQINGEPWGEDGLGGIGKLAPDGTVIDANWVSGLNAPKGLGITEGKLYVADMNQIIEIDLNSGAKTNVFTVVEAGGLNDVTTGNDGTIYFTDSKKGVVYQLKNGEIAMLVNSLQTSNGILSEGESLVIGTWGDESLSRFDLGSGKMTLIADSLYQPDGIEAIGDGGYLVSSWSGMLHHVSSEGKTTLLLDTRLDSISAADIDYIQDKNLLLVPTFYKNSVTAYELKK